MVTSQNRLAVNFGFFLYIYKLQSYNNLYPLQLHIESKNV